MRKQQQYLRMGVFCDQGTDDYLLDSLIYHLRWYDPALGSKRADANARISKKGGTKSRERLVEKVTADLAKLCPPYTCFGRSPEAQGGHWGCWPVSPWALIQARQKGEMAWVFSGAPWPDGTQPYVLVLEENGGIALYDRKDRIFVWASESKGVILLAKQYPA
jgi:hypothetical protein